MKKENTFISFKFIVFTSYGIGQKIKNIEVRSLGICHVKNIQTNDINDSQIKLKKVLFQPTLRSLLRTPSTSLHPYPLCLVFIKSPRKLNLKYFICTTEFPAKSKK